MTGEQAAALKDVARAITEPLQQTLLEDICRRVAKAGRITSTAEYQIYRAEALGLSEGVIRQAIQQQTGVTDRTLNQMFRYVMDKTVRFEDNGSLRQMVEAYAEITKHRANDFLKNLWMPSPDGQLYSIREGYEKVIDAAFGQTFSGALDYNTAIRRATKELVNRGIRVIPRRDGNSVNIEYATRSYIMNQLGRMDNAIQRANHDELGCDGWEIDAHAGCAPDHEPVQGRQYSDASYKKLNENLDRPIGELQCKHNASPVILGVDSPQYTPQQLRQMREDNQKGVYYEGQHYTLYEASRQQAQIESHIRTLKNRCLADEALGDEAKLQKDQIRLSLMRQEYKRFSAATHQPTRSERLQVAGFGRSQASRAAYAGKQFTSQHENGILSRGSGTGDGAAKPRLIHKELPRVDPNDQTGIAKLQDQFCELFAKGDVESMLVITAEGKVHFVSNANPYGVDASFLGDELIGSYNLHTHPPATTQFSFSTDADIPSMFEDGTLVMEAVDYKYRYRFERPVGITFEDWDAVRYQVRQDLPDIMEALGYDDDTYTENRQHVLITECCRRLGIDCYRRWRR